MRGARLTFRKVTQVETPAKAGCIAPPSPDFRSLNETGPDTREPLAKSNYSPDKREDRRATALGEAFRSPRALRMTAYMGHGASYGRAKVRAQIR